MTNDNNLNKGSFSRNDLNNRVPRKTTTRTTTDRTRSTTGGTADRTRTTIGGTADRARTTTGGKTDRTRSTATRNVFERKPTDRKTTNKTPNKPKNSGKVKRKKSNFATVAKIMLVVLIVLVVAVSLFFKKMNSTEVNSSAKNKPEETISVNIESGSSVTDIIKSLEDNGVIDSAFHFKYLCKKMGYGPEFKSGYYTFTNHMSFDDIIKALNTGASSINAKKLTVREGEWLSEIASDLESQGVCTAKEFLTAANSRDYDYDFVAKIPERDNLLEGYLFPATYSIEENMSATDIVNMMLAKFDQVVKDNDIEAQAKKLNHTLDDAVIIASLIEGEVKYAPERTLVSSVIYNRLAKNMKLQLDDSVIYSMGKRATRVLYSDLKNNDKHNTYVVDGLPVGPINSPSEDSLKAAVNPDSTNYFYYVVENTTTGQHHFSATYEEHQQAEASYKSQN